MNNIIIGALRNINIQFYLDYLFVSVYNIELRTRITNILN